MSNLKTVIDRLKSEKVKERQEGVALLRSTFAREDAVYSIEDGRGWLVLYQALFTTVKIEKADTVKKSGKSGTAGTAAQRRLTEAAAAVRWLVERSVHCLSKKALTPLLDHLIQMLVHRGQLFTPVALDYIKTIKVLLAWTPHMDHLNVDVWLKLVEISFNIILDDPIEDDLVQIKHQVASPVLADDSMYQSDSLSSEDGNLPSTSRPTGTRKRPLREHSSTPVPGAATDNSDRRTPRHPVSLEQIECGSLLALLFRYSTAPFLAEVERPDPSDPDSFPRNSILVPIAPSLFWRMKCFLERYPTDTSLHHDYLLALQPFLCQAALNRRKEVDDLACRAWNALVGLWGTKNKRIKESLVGILKTLFPFLTATRDAPNHGWADSMQRLWTLLIGEADSRWGIESLSLDSLRLQVSADVADKRGIFVAQTFRAGWNFDASQALAWALLELQADCAEKLFEHSESVHTGSPEGSTFSGKRAKREDPISTLLYSLRTTSTMNVRVYHLQILLFFIDRHWFQLHDALQHNVIATVLQFVSVDEVPIQSWAFLCLAAIAYCDGMQPSSAPPSGGTFTANSCLRGPATWDPIWTHAMRRANVPVVCRAACHVAHTLVGYSRHLLTPQRVLAEIESLAKDLDLQGPSFPYDAVCLFLAQCLRVARQDVRLYRMQLEEKVLSWLLDNWQVGASAKDVGGRSRMPPHTISDFLDLLESVCGCSRRSDPVCRMVLPDCDIVNVIEEHHKTRIIRDYVLHARLPVLGRHGCSLGDTCASQQTVSQTTREGQELVPPRGRERRISGFLIKTMESLISEWEMARDNSVHPTAEKVRQSFDAAITALVFESVLSLNGTHGNRRVIQSAGKMVVLLAPFITDAKWTPEERLLILKALEPLVVDVDPDDIGDGWTALIPPGQESGIKAHILRDLQMRISRHVCFHSQRRCLQLLLWENVDVQNSFDTIAEKLRQLLSTLTDQSIGRQDPGATENDGFGPIRTTQSITPQEEHTSPAALAIRSLAETCIVFLASIPVLQCPTGQTPRDKELIKLVVECPEEKLLLLGPPLLTVVRARLLTLSLDVLDNLLVKCADLLRRYSHALNDQFHFLVVDLLKSTLHIWMRKEAVTSAIGEHVQVLCGWISNMMEAAETKKKTTSWKIRDLVARFLAGYLDKDPSQTTWPAEYHDAEIKRPLSTLLALNLDEDIRVRFRAAVLSAALFAVDPDELIREHENLDRFYQLVRDSLPRDLAQYECMLTRTLCLGNIMIASSHVRRGPYWHLLEAAFHSPLYSRHIEAVLRGVSQRLGLTKPNELFEAYASQIALSVRQNFLDILRLPPNLLGYANMKESAEAAFYSFTPTNLMEGGGSQDAVAHGRQLFVNHCSATHRTMTDGLRACIGDLIGLQLVSLVDAMHVSDSALATHLEELFRSKNIDLQPLGGFAQCVQQNAASVAASVIRTFGDQDFSDDGAIIEGLRAHGLREAAQTFTSLNKYRRLDDFRFHPPNLPRFGTDTILRALQWCTSVAVSKHVTAISYHVLHQIFAELHSTPFVNEQLRLLNGISLLVAVLDEKFKVPALLHTFIQKSCSLLAQADLTQAAQSYLEWGFSVYQTEPQLDPRFPDILIRVCALSDDDHATSTVSGATKRNRELSSWVDEQVLVLCSNPRIKAQVLKALPAWSHQPSPALLSVVEDITADNLSATLSDHLITSNKFRLVRRLLELAEQHAYNRSQFAMTDFWRLKDYIPPIAYLQRDDIDAFASLLVANTGNIYGFGSEHPFPQTLRARHQKDAHHQEETPVDPSPHRSVLQTLLAMLDGINPSEAHLAYLTLKSLVSASSEETLVFHLWSAEYLAPLEFFQQFPVALSSRPARSVAELDTNPHPPSDFAQWICSLSTLLSDILNSSDKFYAQLTPLVTNNVQFAEEILPVLVHTLLSREVSQGASSATSARKNLSVYFTAILTAEDPNRSCMRAIVDVILHLRSFRPAGSNWLAHDKWLDVDFRLLAQSAVGCGSYTTALLFLELAFEYGQLNKESSDSIEHLLFEIYGHIDEPDGFYGIKTTDLHHFLIKRFHHEHQWDKAFRFHGAAIEAGSRESIDADGLLQSFHAFGFDSVAIGTLQGSQNGFQPNEASSTMSYQLGWRTETWDLPDTGDSQDSNITLYRALRAIYRERDTRVIDTTIQSALCNSMERLRTLGNEDITEIREIARNIMSLNQLTQWRRGPIQDYLSCKSPDIRSMSQLVDIDPEFEFSSLERILATRVSLIRSARRKEERERIGNMITPFNHSLLELEKRCLVGLSVAARKSNKLQVALNSIVKARRLEGISTHEVSQEFAHVLWLQNEQKLAVQFLKDLLLRQEQTVSSEPEPVIERALSMARLGSWISEACLEKPMDIKKYFDTATALAMGVEKQIGTRGNACASVFHKCALFAEYQYYVIIKSPDAVRWKTYMDRKSLEIKQRESQLLLLRTQLRTSEYSALSADQKKAKAVLAEDAEAYKQHNGALFTFLDLAIDMYSRCLAASDTFDGDVPIRFCSLWFANFEDQRLQDTLKVAVARIPSRKFVFLSHQLSARISQSSQDALPASQQILQGLVIRMCQEHPFHSLYQVYCIRPEKSGQLSSRRLSSRHEPTLLQAQLDRSSAASDIFDRLLGDPRYSTRVKAIEQVCDASIEWARYPIKDNRAIKAVKGSLYIVPDNLAIRRLRDIQVPVVTSHPAIDATLKYDRCVWISHYDTTFTKPGGVNFPKVNTCYGSNGEKYKQLFKGGNDDLRQDAVMEQVFDLVNVVLECDRETKKRDLKVRGYTVLPLAAQAGVIEFVGNTDVLQAWLGTAHQRYRPSDLKHSDIVQILKQTRARHPGRVDALVAQYNDIRAKTAPVMRHYFTEKHKSPIAWFATRLNYIRSVATTSIVGHVLGLGDRHVSNILMDNGTGEVVHIDLGIAFDQGKLLPIPERVPFRMTRDMVDGMGYSGTQGVFQRCAEETLRVLRERSDVIMTVLEVFKHDPLHSWTASELKIKKIQDSTNEPAGRVSAENSRFGVGHDAEASPPVNEAADRALNSVARKLDKSLSVEYTVNELIAEATDIVNLATIYAGWSPDY